MVERLFLAVPWGCQRFVIVVFPDHTHLLFLELRHAITSYHSGFINVGCPAWTVRSLVQLIRLFSAMYQILTLSLYKDSPVLKFQ